MDKIWSYFAFNNNTWTCTMQHVGTERGAKVKAKRLAIDSGLSHYRVWILGHNNEKTYKIEVA